MIRRIQSWAWDHLLAPLFEPRHHPMYAAYLEAKDESWPGWQPGVHPPEFFALRLQDMIDSEWGELRLNRFTCPMCERPKRLGHMSSCDWPRAKQAYADHVAKLRSRDGRAPQTPG
jgi:hypothetical protein